MNTRSDARTADRILDIAERLVQTRGFNAFSYADVSKAIGIRKASLHHHFATKAGLGLALLARYRRSFAEALHAIEEGSSTATERLARYVELYGTVLRRNRMCMCGMLAADIATLPRAMRESVAGFFEENEAWLARVLDEGRRNGHIAFEGSPASMAEFFVSSLEGAMLLARGSGKVELFAGVARQVLRVCPPPPSRGRARRAGRR